MSINNTLSFYEVLTKLNIDCILKDSIQIKDGTQNLDCPFCLKSAKFSIRDNKYFKCYNTNCKAHEGGGIPDFLILLGLASTVKEAFQIINQIDGKQWYHTAQLNKRSATLSKIWIEFRLGAAENTSLISDYASRRGWPIDFTYGYGVDLLSKGFSNSELEEVGLLSKSGRQYLLDRLIFPIVNPYNQDIIHFQGRDLYGESELRWLSTKENLGEGINKHLFNLHSYWNKDISKSALYLTEGIGDCLTLLNLGVDAIASFGVEPVLKHLLLKIKPGALVIILDNDKYALGTANAGRYKSWDPFLKHVIELASIVNYPIYCVMPPDLPGIKDVNEWALSTPNFNVNYFLTYCKENFVILDEFCLDLWGARPDKHSLLWKLAKNRKSFKTSFIDFINNSELSWPEYVLKYLV